jgi:acetylglutamate kinase
VRVIKLGGSLLEDGARRADALQEILKAYNCGEQIVLVHGGGKHIDTALNKLGIPKRTHAGLRITDDATLAVVVSVLAGSVNKMLVAELTALGVRCAGISGADAGTLMAEVHPPIDGVELGHVGRIVRSDPRLLRAMLAQDILPIVSSVAQGPKGALLNVNADSAAAAVAAAVGATFLQFITDVAGLLDHNGDVVSSINAAAAQKLLATEVVSGGMKPKLQAALGALQAGVARIHIGGGTQIVAP